MSSEREDAAAAGAVLVPRTAGGIEAGAGAGDGGVEGSTDFVGFEAGAGVGVGERVEISMGAGEVEQVMSDRDSPETTGGAGAGAGLEAGAGVA